MRKSWIQIIFIIAYLAPASADVKLNKVLLQKATLKSNRLFVAFTYTGANQSWTVPTGVTSITIKAWGAGGGGAPGYAIGAARPKIGGDGGGGGFSKATFAVTPGDTIAVIVGGKGLKGTWDGLYCRGGSGGGYSGIQINGTLKLIAGGAGGGGCSFDAVGGPGGGGGGTTGQAGTGTGCIAAAGGGTQAAGGVAANCDEDGFAGTSLTGGNARQGNPGPDGGWPGGGKAGDGGGGGAGYFGGGGGGVAPLYDTGGGGGSGWIDAAGTSTVLTQATSRAAAGTGDPDWRENAGFGGHKGNTIVASLTDGEDGYVIITY